MYLTDDLRLCSAMQFNCSFFLKKTKNKKQKKKPKKEIENQMKMIRRIFFFFSPISLCHSNSSSYHTSFLKIAHSIHTTPPPYIYIIRQHTQFPINPHSLFGCKCCVREERCAEERWPAIFPNHNFNFSFFIQKCLAWSVLNERSQKIGRVFVRTCAHQMCAWFVWLGLLTPAKCV